MRAQSPDDLRRVKEHSIQRTANRFGITVEELENSTGGRMILKLYANCNEQETGRRIVTIEKPFIVLCYFYHHIPYYLLSEKVALISIQILYHWSKCQSHNPDDTILECTTRIIGFSRYCSRVLILITFWLFIDSLFLFPKE